MSVTFVEGDLQLGRFGGVLRCSRADDGKNAPVVTMNQFELRERLTNPSFRKISSVVTELVAVATATLSLHANPPPQANYFMTGGNR